MSQNSSSSAPPASTSPFSEMVRAICAIDHQLQAQTARAINAGLTIRNWLIGWHIHEYEQNGADRAAYGARLLDNLSKQLQHHGISRCEPRELRRYRLFFQTYPQIRDSLTPEFRNLHPEKRLESTSIRESLTPVSGQALIARDRKKLEGVLG